MKRINLLLLTICLCSIAVVTESCEKEDSCAIIECNSGTQNEETCNCDCPLGFSGLNCEVEQRINFLGDYEVSEVCSSDLTFTENYEMKIVSDSDAANQFSILNIYNFLNQGVSLNNALVKATIITDTTFEVNEQNLLGDAADIVVSGSGSIENDVVTFIYTIRDTSPSPNIAEDSCTVIMTRI